MHFLSDDTAVTEQFTSPNHDCYPFMLDSDLGLIRLPTMHTPVCADVLDDWQVKDDDELSWHQHSDDNDEQHQSNKLSQVTTSKPLSNNVTEQPPSLEIIPQKYDIICGRGRFGRSHVGNKLFRTIIDANRERYQAASCKEKKSFITAEIVTMLRSYYPGGRFLKRDNDTSSWVDAGDQFAKEKVSHALRSGKGDQPLAGAKHQRKCNNHTQSRKLLPNNHNTNDIFGQLLTLQQELFQQLLHQTSK